MTAEQQAIFRTLPRGDRKVARAWTLKERVRQFWDDASPGAARTVFASWFWRAPHSRLRPMAAVAHLIRRHLPNVLTYLTHRVTNAGLEAVNATIQEGQEDRSRLPQRRARQDGDLFPLRRAGSLSNPHESVKSLKKVAPL
ncbi:MAG: hypothetical protein D6690_08710 [Nitrospirae bacterium]|nr:MAG: hypothetical protein D6690_08710 [Nitrospirota bacterium]